jgi:glycyl-tRNA synthetase beta chain
VFAAGADDDITRLLARADAVAGLLDSDDGANLLTAYRRAANILRIETRKDGPHDGPVNEAYLRTEEEHRLVRIIADSDEEITLRLQDDDYGNALRTLATLRAPVDAFFDKVTVNATEPDLRLNRLRLLHKLRSTMDRVADFAKIEG